MAEKTLLVKFVEALKGVPSARMDYEERERRAIPPEKEVAVTDQDLERARQLVPLLSAPRPVIVAPAVNPFYVEEFWRAVAYALQRPFKVILVEADQPYYLLSKADAENGTTTEGKFAYCARRGYVIVLAGEATDEEKRAGRVPAGIEWLAKVTQDFKECPVGWAFLSSGDSLANPLPEGQSLPIHPNTIIVPTWMM